MTRREGVVVGWGSGGGWGWGWGVGRAGLRETIAVSERNVYYGGVQDSWLGAGSVERRTDFRVACEM